MRVKVSAAMARLRFNGCDPEYIRTTCHARCCESSTAPSGTIITIHPSEREAIERRGGVVEAGLLQPVKRRCPFKTAANLCGLHGSEDKPFGCIASPFTLNRNGTLIVRNRYRLLRCYDDGRRLPAYVAFRASLDLIFGLAEAARICGHLEAGGGDLMAEISERSYRLLIDNDDIKRGNAMAANAHIAGGGGGGFADSTLYQRKRAAEQRLGRELSLEEFRAEHDADGPRQDGALTSGTSIFDPVLCELIYRWFAPPGGLVLDPFAGGSVRGIVAAKLGRRYLGVDLSGRQLEANREQARRLINGSASAPEWRQGDSRQLGKLAAGAEADLIFTCPPYADLERYSDEPADLSTLAYPAFREAMAQIIGAACALLKPDRFACFVVGDVRGPDGNYYGLPGDIADAFEAAGLALYNEVILVTAVGSLPIRAAKQFETSRKLGKTHQNVLIFVKGNARAATAAVGPVEFGAITQDEPLGGAVE
jgi:DNA modification methylase